MGPDPSEDLTVIVEPDADGSWQVLRSPLEAEDDPRYEMVGRLKPKKLGSFRFVTATNDK